MKFQSLITCSVMFLLLGAVSNMATAYETAEIYNDLREQVLNLNAEQIDLPATKDLQVIAFLMETGYEDAAFSLVAIADGTASLYFSNGGGMIGAGEYEEGRKEALKLIKESNKYIGSMKKTNSFPLPAEAHTKYYAITNQGVFTVDAFEEDFGYERHPLSSIFHQGHRLISVIRQVDEHRNQNQ